jgi:protein tyrosine kinase modulator
MSQDYLLQEEETSPIDIGRYLGVAKRRYIFFLIPFLLILLISVGVIVFLKPIYQSTGTILVETQQIPTDLIQSSVTSDPSQRITVLQQRVMTRRNLLQIIDNFEVFGVDRQRLPVSQLIAKMQSQINVSVITSEFTGRRRGGAAIAFQISFDHENPEIAAKVTNELVTLFLSENVRTRTARAADTTAFLNSETEKLRSALIKTENEIVEYKQKNRDALPEHLDLRLRMLERSEAELREYVREIRALEEERRYLQIELTSARTGRSGAGGATVVSELQENIEALKKTLLDASTRLTDSHPDIKALKKRIDALEQQQIEEENEAARAAAENKPLKNAPYNPLVEKLQIRMSAIDAKIAEARIAIEKLKKKVEEIEAIIIEIPQVERGLSVLNRTYGDILEKFNVLESKQARAQLSQNLEEDKKAERFILLEPPTVPTEPIRPDRIKILGIGSFIAFAAGVGLVVLIELLDQRIRSSSELEAVLKHPPIVSIPYITTPAEMNKRRSKLVLYILAALVFIAIVFAAVHFLYQPLDDLFYKIWVALDKKLISIF